MKRRRIGIVALIFLVIAITVFLAFRGESPVAPQANRSAAEMANNRGIALMEQFNYPAAIETFAEAVRLDPTWMTSRINHAIALLNTASPRNLDLAVAEFEMVLGDHPEELHALYGLGIIALHRNHLEEAQQRFLSVTRLDPRDPAAWYHLGSSYPVGSADARRCFDTAYRLDPYLTPAIYGLAMNLRREDPDRAAQLLKEHTALSEAGWDRTVRLRYSEMGKYGDVIGGSMTPAPESPIPLFSMDNSGVFELPRGARWATVTDVTPSAREIRARRGAVLVAADLDGDGKTDLVLLSAVIENGKVRDAMLRNRGNGRFEDVTASSKLVGAGTGVAVGDFDADGRPDLAITTASGVSLYRNAGAGVFADVTAKSGLDTVKGACQGVAWVDLDQDGDLDLIITQGGIQVLLNVGEAPPGEPGQPPPALVPKFRLAELPGLSHVPAESVVISDLDNDGDLDVLALPRNGVPIWVANDRLLRFRQLPIPGMPERHPGTGGLVIALNRGEFPDLLLLSEDRSPALLTTSPGPTVTSGVAGGPSLRHAAVADVDLDGAPDVVGLSNRGIPTLLRNQGGKLVHSPEALGRDFDWPADLVAAVSVDLDDDGRPDLVIWSATRGLEWRRNLGNGNRSVRVHLSGRRERGGGVRSNPDGIGARVTALAGPLSTWVENTTLSTGLGQSRTPLILGIGRPNGVDAIRVRWPDGVPQAELDPPLNRVVRIEETNRRTTSCPVVSVWNGKTYEFVTDFLGASAAGELQPDGTVRPPRPVEAVLLEPPPVPDAEGRIRLKIFEPLDEVLYLDSVRLEVIDHVSHSSAVPDERFSTGGPDPTGQLLLLSEAIHPVRARTGAGTDVTEALKIRDRVFANGWRPRSWLGYADLHTLDLDFADRLSRFDASQRLVLELSGWTDYPYPESIWAANQAGVPLVPPVLERKADGKWVQIADLGFPAGLPRVMTREITGLTIGTTCQLRIRTNMQLGWDRIVVRPLVSEQEKGVELLPFRAVLSHPGLAREVGPPPVRYDQAHFDTVPTSEWVGKFPDPGNVLKEVQSHDGKFAICGPGRELEMTFDGSRLPALTANRTRTFVLRATGFTRDTSPFTLNGGKILPLPSDPDLKQP